MRDCKGRNLGNAEVNINYETGRTKFKYNAHVSARMTYFNHRLFILCGWFLFLSLFFTYFLPYLLDVCIAINSLYGLSTAKFAACLLIFLPILASFKFAEFCSYCTFGWLSVYAHEKIPYLRKNFASISSIGIKATSFFDLKKYDYVNGKFFTIDKTLVIFNYDIIYYQFLYEGNNRVVRFYTKSGEPSSHVGEHHRYLAYVIFEKPINEGRFYFRKNII